jgi:hypothetical protein
MAWIEEFMLEHAWRRYDNIMWGISNIENKSSSIIVADSILIAIIIGLFQHQTIAVLFIAIVPIFVSFAFASWSIASKTPGVISPNPAGEISELLGREYDDDEIRLEMVRATEAIHAFAAKAQRISEDKLAWNRHSIYSFLIGLVIILAIFLRMLVG